jgi:chitinase
MAMEFGASRPSTTSFADASLAGIDATAGQLRDAYRRAGQPIAEGESYRRIGVTPMIGQNITPSDRLDVDGAQALYAGAVRRGVLRFSMWSLNRDRPCVGNIDPLIANDLCSGVPQEKLAFSHIFGAGNAPAVANEQVAFATASRVQTRQADAAAAPNNVGPYDAWRPHREYEADDKVVWNGRVFVAKWWNVDNQPDALVEHDWDTPWRLVGPVLATDPGPPTPPTVPPNTYPTWNRLTTFNAGDRVERRGVAYEAKWASRGEDPAADVDNDWQTPWKVVSPDAADPRSDS